jgi:hypothetical protein
MVEKDRVISLLNRDTGSVGYTLDDTGTHRRFTPGETKQVTFDEVEKLSWAPGGKELLKDYLIIQDEEAAREILGDIEPEYFYTKETIQKLLSEGTLEQLQDTLDFGPKGVVDLVKQEAVEMRIDSTVKREEIQKHTSFNVDRAIQIDKESEEDGEDNKDATTTHRRANPIAASEPKNSTRRANAMSTTSESKYKIIQK